MSWHSGKSIGHFTAGWNRVRCVCVCVSPETTLTSSGVVTDKGRGCTVARLTQTPSNESVRCAVLGSYNRSLPRTIFVARCGSRSPAPLYNTKEASGDPSSEPPRLFFSIIIEDGAGGCYRQKYVFCVGLPAVGLGSGLVPPWFYLVPHQGRERAVCAQCIAFASI